ncbi:hypothetical protein ACFFMP_13590 [Pseudoroseomonas cervicalis]
MARLDWRGVSPCPSASVTATTQGMKGSFTAPEGLICPHTA